ncbi:MAG: HPr family phosphocarrier protein [Clostridia bacterium]|nr:HPr family phosphocarrier protein [Clostridia bacterium]
MKNLVIRLREIKDVYDFVGIVTSYPGDIDIVSGRYRVNAKSIMGIFALDLTQPLDLEIYGDDPDSVTDKLSRFLA